MAGLAGSATLTVEVRTTGSDTQCAGIFDSQYAGGTDYSQQDAAQFSGAADMTMHAATNTKVVPGTHTPTAADVGNGVYISAGTNWTVGYYLITAQDGTYWTLDRSPAAAGELNAATWYMGGGLASPGQAGYILANGGQTGGTAFCSCTVYVKYHASNTYNISNGTLNTAGNRFLVTANATLAAPFFMVGYSTNRTKTNTDSKPIFKLTASITTNYMVGVDGSYAYFHNLDINGDGQTGRGIIVGRNGGNITNCIARSFTGATAYGIVHNGNGMILNCEAYDNRTSGSYGILASVSYGSASIIKCTSHDHTGSGIGQNSHAAVTDCAAWNCSQNGFVAGDSSSYMKYFNRCTSYSCNNGFAVGGGNAYSWFLNCHAEKNTAYGFTSTAATVQCWMYNCSAYDSGTANYRTAYLPNNTGFIDLTSSAFVDGANDDFRLNDTAGGGAALRAAGYPSTLPGTNASTISYPDVGAFQHQDSGGATTTYVINVMD